MRFKTGKSHVAAMVGTVLAASVAASLFAGSMAAADVDTHTEYKAYCTGPAWSGPWVSYRWNAEDHRQERMRNFRNAYCGIKMRTYGR